MKTNESQIIRGSETGRVTDMLQQAEYMVMQGEMDAQEAEAAEEEMRMKLEQAQAAKERKEQAENNAKESGEKIQEAIA